jgi:hypothetical protein
MGISSPKLTLTSFQGRYNFLFKIIENKVTYLKLTSRKPKGFLKKIQAQIFPSLFSSSIHSVAGSEEIRWPLQTGGEISTKFIGSS